MTEATSEPRNPVGNVTVQLLDEGSSSPSRLVVSESLAIALARAAFVNEAKDHFALSFTSLFIGLLAGGPEEDFGEWLRQHFARSRVDVDALIGRRDVTPEAFESLRTMKAPLYFLDKPLLRTASARSALTEAERVSRDGSASPGLVDVRHLIAALVGLPQYHDADFRALQIDRRTWGRAFVPEVSRLYPEETAFWQKWLQGVFPGEAIVQQGPEKSDDQRPIWQFAPDIYGDKDLLGIEREAHGLASLIASHRTSLPLSIGLFGHWGSGKTFFMRHVQERVRLLCDRARKSDLPQSKIAYFRNVAQIEFNAWHYSEGELLPSLVDHILQNLRIQKDESAGEIKKRRELLLTRIAGEQSASAATEEQVKAAQERVQAKRGEIEKLQKSQAAQRDEVAKKLTAWTAAGAFSTAISLDSGTAQAAQAALEKLGITAVSGAARDVQAAIDGAYSELAGIGALLMPLLRGRERWKRTGLLLAAIAALILVGPLIYWLLAKQGETIATISSWAGRCAAFLAVFAKWLQGQTRWIAARRQELTSAKRAVDLQIEEQTRKLQADQARELTVHIQELERLRAGEAVLVQELSQRTQAVGQLETELAQMSSTYRLNQFIMDRQNANDYRKFLGFMALIRRDFDKLSDLIEKSNKAILNGDAVKPEDDPRLNRIVLYIDDLDRCPEDRVVEVLRAVHLLLAFPLFVVIVAVDSRWLTECLNEKYPKIFGASGGQDNGSGTTPLDYLEKIFQIPLWLHPLSPAKRVEMVQALLKERGTVEAPVSISTAASSGEQRVAGTEVSSPARDLPRTPPEAVPTAAIPKGALGQTEHHPPIDPYGPIDLNPASLEIREAEWTFIEHLGPFLSQTPRVLKRLANTYRLIKGALPDEDLRAFVAAAPGTGFELCLFHLAVLMSMPAFAPSYLRAMKALQVSEHFARHNVSKWIDDLGALLREGETPRPRDWYAEADRPHWLKLGQHLADPTLERRWEHVPMDQFAGWATRVARFTFTSS